MQVQACTTGGAAPPRAEAAAPGAARRRRWLAGIPYFGLLLLWGLGCWSWSLLAPPLARLLPASRRERFGRAGIHRGFRLLLRLTQASGLCRFELEALEALRDAGPLVVAANHPSLIDAVLLAARLPRAVCICKASLWRNRFLGGGLRLAGYLRNDAPLPLVRAGVASLRQGNQLVVFPEGTRTAPGERRLHFQAGFATMALAAGVPVQTVIIESTPFLNRGRTLFRLPPLPVVCSVRLGERFAVDGPAKPFVRRLESYFAHELETGGRPRPAPADAGLWPPPA